MRGRVFILLGILVLAFAFSAWALDQKFEAGEPPLASTAPQQVSNDSDNPEEPCIDEDGDGILEECGPPLACSCLCKGVAVTVTIYPDIHGEKCSDVNGRPCNTGAGPSTYNGCV
jgi:hypothetical protein